MGCARCKPSWVGDQRGVHPGHHGERGDAHPHRDRQDRQVAQHLGGVVGLGFLEHRNTVADRLHPGQRGAALRESPQDQKRRERAGRVLGRGTGYGRFRRPDVPPSATLTPAQTNITKMPTTNP